MGQAGWNGRMAIMMTVMVMAGNTWKAKETARALPGVSQQTERHPAFKITVGMLCQEYINKAEWT